MSVRPWLLAAVLAVLLGITAVPAVRHWREQPPRGPEPIRATWTAPPDLTVGSGSEYPFGLALSPDGRRVAFSAARDGHVQLWLQDLSTGRVTPLPGTERAASPFWSHDASRIGFFADGAIKAFALDGAEVTELGTVEAARGASWSEHGDLVFANDDGGLSIVAGAERGGATADGGRLLTSIDRAAGELAHVWPAFVPSGTHIVAFVRAESAARQGLYLIAIADGTRTRLTGAAASGIPVRDRLIYANDGALISQTLDVAAGRLTGRAQLHGVRVGVSPLGQLLATAADDALVFSEPMTTQQELVWFSKEGERVERVGAPADIWSAAVAPDGRRVAATVLDPLLRTLDVVLFDGRTLMPTRLSLSIDTDEGPVWSPDGRRVAWVQGRHTIMTRGAGAVLPADEVVRFDELVRVSQWTPDGDGLVVSRTLAETREDIWLVPAGGSGTPRAVVSSPFADVQGVVSPDGRWLAYASDEAGEMNVYVQLVQDRSPEPGTRERVSSGGGSDPRWSRSGRELFFRRGREIHVAVPASGRGQNAVATTSMVFQTEVPVRWFDLAPDGRFLLNLPVVAAPPPATLVVHWAARGTVP
jgi:Tol biopolymer transport system component